MPQRTNKKKGIIFVVHSIKQTRSHLINKIRTNSVVFDRINIQFLKRLIKKWIFNRCGVRLCRKNIKSHPSKSDFEYTLSDVSHQYQTILSEIFLWKNMSSDCTTQREKEKFFVYNERLWAEKLLNACERITLCFRCIFSAYLLIRSKYIIDG